MRSTGFEATRPWLQHLAGMELLHLVADTLAPEGIDAMPLKGMWLKLAGVYDPPEQRPITDVDLLVRSQDYGRAQAALLRAGFRLGREQGWQSVLERSQAQLALDLHREIFEPLCFGLSASDLWARASGPGPRGGMTLCMPQPLDAFGHLVGHFVRSGPTGRDSAHCADFEATLRHFGWPADHVASYLEAHGLARAGRLAMSMAVDHGPAPRAGLVLAAMHPDPVGEMLVRTTAGAARLPWVPRQAHSLAGLLLSRSLPAGVVSAAERGLKLIFARRARA